MRRILALVAVILLCGCEQPPHPTHDADGWPATAAGTKPKGWKNPNATPSGTPARDTIITTESYDKTT